uniref:Uncharacterized protein n=1 Tax=Megaselia scalaris TaxID=36166 RepID=T1GZ11_MEGSC
SIIIYKKETSTLYFGRDSLGRNSLLLEKTESEIIISSTLEQPEPGNVSDCMELPPLGIYKITDSIDQLSLYPWKHFDDYQKLELSKLELLFNSINLLIPIEPKWLLPEPTE